MGALSNQQKCTVPRLVGCLDSIAQGILYFLGHPQLITSLICPILITLLWAIAVVIFGFAYLLQLQAHALIKANCPAGVAW